MASIYNAYDWFTGSPVTLTDVGEGWKRLQKTGDKLFYKVTTTSGPSGIDEHSDSRNLHIFPNPVKDVLNITSNAIIKEVQISNLLGMIIHSTTSNCEELSIDLSRFCRGTYLSKIIFGNGDSVARKIIIE